MARVLVVEDSIETQALLKRALHGSHVIDMVSGIEQAKQLLLTSTWDLLVLDRGLPDGDGLDLCGTEATGEANIKRKIPILMLSARDSVNDRVEGLTAGADDYMTKPFEPSELLARIDAILRRGPSQEAQFIVTLGNLILNLETQTAYFKKGTSEQSINLTPIEFKILRCLVKNYGKEVSREHLVEVVWGQTHLSERNVDSRVCHLRKKLSESGFEIKNRREYGYFLDNSRSEKARAN